MSSSSGQQQQIYAYSRRDSFGLGWADQWDYKFNDDKLLGPPQKASSPLRSAIGGGGRAARKAVGSPLRSSGGAIVKKAMSPLRSSGGIIMAGLKSRPPPSGLNRQISSSVGKAKSAAAKGGQKLKSGTSVGLKWLKKQVSLKSIKQKQDEDEERHRHLHLRKRNTFTEAKASKI